MTQDLAGRAEPPNIAKQIWPFCPGCGRHEKTAEYRADAGVVRCAACVAGLRRRWSRGWWR